MIRLNILIGILLTTLSVTAQVGRELYRPVYHYSPAYNWMNDPNGLVYFNGKYHLFYQYNPQGLTPDNISWGHATSTDLVNWEEKPVAIPKQNGVMIYSGSVVVDWNNTSGFGINGKAPLVAIYTGSSNVQDQRIAYSNDEGQTWTNYSGNPVLTMNNNQFRDPKVIWHNESQKWIMVVSLGSYQGLRFYSSPDLKNWTSMPGFGSIGNQSGFWECPDLFKVAADNDTSNMKWVLVHSVSPNAQYFIGDFNGDVFSWEKKEPQGILIDDFEKESYGSWHVNGNSFGLVPATGSGNVPGYLGRKLVNSLNASGNAAQGKLISSDFVILKNNISFLIGGGYHPEKAYIKLVVNGQTVRTATGSNESLLKWKNWDVSSYAGQTARIEIVDSVTGSWGHLTVDHIIQSNDINDSGNYGPVDYGKDFYALQSFFNVPDGRRIWLAWMNNWNYALQVPTTPWKGIMSIPREVKLETYNGHLKLVQKPIEELTMLRGDSLHFNMKTVSFINNSLRNVLGTALNTPVFKQFELKAKLSVLNRSGFSLKFKKSGFQYSEFVFDFLRKEIRFNRSKSSGRLAGYSYFDDLQIAPLIIENDSIDLQLFVDNSSAELFTAGGKVVMSNQIFPDSTSNKIEITSLDDDFIIEEFDIWKLEKKSRAAVPVTESNQLFSVYPNPVVNNNGVTIKIKDNLAGEVNFKLFSATGMLIFEFQPAFNSIILPINKMPASKGLYFLKATCGSSTQTEKILVLGR